MHLDRKIRIFGSGYMIPRDKDKYTDQGLILEDLAGIDELYHLIKGKALLDLPQDQVINDDLVSLN